MLIIFGFDFDNFACYNYQIALCWWYLHLEHKKNRKAQFRTAISLNINDQKFIFEGICKGEILTKKQGEKGFGYDPIFKPEGYNQSFAEMTSKEKNTISHRGIAVQKLVAFLNNY